MEQEDEWVILDTETDGFEPPIHTLEVAAQKMRGMLKDGEPFRIFLDHGVRIPPAATAVHGYTATFLREHGVDPVEGHDQLRAYVGSRHIVAHYLQYDWNTVLVPEWRRLQISPIGQRGFCSWQLARRAIPESASHRLDILREMFNLQAGRAHSALGDVEAVCDLLARVIAPRMERLGGCSFPSLRAFCAEKPLLKCHCLVEGRNYYEELQRIDAERKARATRGQIIELCSANPSLDLWTNIGLIARDCTIEFPGRVFLFTGKMIWGSRSYATRMVESLGGLVSSA